MQTTFILVEPATPENVGAAARAIKTMGFSRLWLVNPCDYLSEPARWLAHASVEILENAVSFNTLEDAIKPFDFIVGTSAKKRSVKYNYFNLKELPAFLQDKGETVHNMAVVFGREESGLTNSELKLCDLVTTIPLKNSYPSLNLAQAVMVYAYKLSKINFTSSETTGKNENSLKALQKKIRTVLLQTGFNENTNIFPRFLERLNFLNEDDIHLFHSFCNKFLENKK